MFRQSNTNDTDCRSAFKYGGYTIMGLSLILGVMTCATTEGPRCTSSFFQAPNCRFTVLALMCEGVLFGLGAIANLGSRITCKRTPEESTEAEDEITEEAKSTGSEPEEKYILDDEIEYIPNLTTSDDLKVSLLSINNS